MTKSEPSSSARIIVAGASGLLGPYLMDEAQKWGRPLGLSRSGPDLHCDLLDFPRVRKILDEVKPSIVIHAAALTNVDSCEQQAELAHSLHHDSVANIAQALGEDSVLVYISTDQVYPDAPGPHPELPVDPVNIYGASKLAGESAALDHPNSIVIRTNLFGPSKTEGRQSLSDFMTAKLSSGSPIKLFSDALFSPLHMETLSAMIFLMIAKGLTGIFNLGCRDGMSKMAFGYAIAEHLTLPLDNVEVVESSTLPGRVPRVKDLRMDVFKLEKALGTRLPTLIEEVHKL